MLEAIKNKYLLLDTCLLIATVRDEDSFSDFFEQIKLNNISLAMDSTIEFEFLRSSNTMEALQVKAGWLSKFFGAKVDRFNLPVTIVQYEDARKIANLYSFSDSKNSSKISAADCLIAAQLKKYEGNLFLATLNNCDFPLSIFNRREIITIDSEKQIFNVGIYSFSAEKYLKQAKRFVKAGKTTK